MSDVVSRRPLVRDLNEFLVCSLCAGYFIDATRLTDCFHVFCKSCLLQSLQRQSERLAVGTDPQCPECGIELRVEAAGEAKEGENSPALACLRRDQQLQELVFKLVPGLRLGERSRRREFMLAVEEQLAKSAATPVQFVLRPRQSPSECRHVSSPAAATYLLLPVSANVADVAEFLAEKLHLSHCGRVSLYMLNTRLPMYWTAGQVEQLRRRLVAGSGGGGGEDAAVVDFREPVPLTFTIV